VATIGELAVNVVARTEKLNRGLKNSGKLVSRFAASVKKHQAVIGRFVNTLGVGTAISGTGLVFALRESANEIDRLAKVSSKLGVTVDSLIGLQHAANQTGVASEKLNMGLQRMVRRVSEAAKGTGEAKDAIRELGLNAARLSNLSPDQQFARIADAMSRISSQSDRVRLAFKLFDSEGVDLVNTLRLGSVGLRAMADDAKNLGLTVGDQAGKIERFNDQMDRLRKLGTGAIRGALPAITGASEVLEGFMLPRSGSRTRVNSERGKSVYEEFVGSFFADKGVSMPGIRRSQFPELFRRQQLAGADKETIRNDQRAPAVGALGRLASSFGAGFRNLVPNVSIGSIGRGANRVESFLRQQILRNAFGGGGASVSRGSSGSGGMSFSGINRALDANSMEGFTALRANRRNASAEIAKNTEKSNKHLESIDKQMGELARMPEADIWSMAGAS